VLIADGEEYEIADRIVASVCSNLENRRLFDGVADMRMHAIKCSLRAEVAEILLAVSEGD
jgi:hypothetical protein